MIPSFFVLGAVGNVTQSGAHRRPAAWIFRGRSAGSEIVVVTPQGMPANGKSRAFHGFGPVSSVATTCRPAGRCGRSTFPPRANTQTNRRSMAFSSGGGYFVRNVRGFLKQVVGAYEIHVQSVRFVQLSQCRPAARNSPRGRSNLLQLILPPRRNLPSADRCKPDGGRRKHCPPD
ncbi:hypothetical protein PEL8287_01966 [Roseovarius litorisediminis]|uniref:Uncharacterized protein n=1 Tax=Roseovarius litorisediminis TaxID=1312363 RepID=A0A1Y5SKG7_9RHOB|nr:hypothetical protein PEL8287_01966 [Roseovarius litorisediminis]